MKIGAALSTKPEARSAAMEATLQAANGLGEREPDLAIVFASAHFAPQAEAIVDAVHEAAAAQLDLLFEQPIARCAVVR